jgi:hypothetical protein
MPQKYQQQKRPPAQDECFHCYDKGHCVILEVYQVALLVKNLYKVSSSADLPWVRILWDNYYNNGKLQQQKKIHSGGVT